MKMRLSGIFIENHIDDLFFGVFHHLFAAAVAVGCTGTGIRADGDNRKPR